VKYIYLDYKNNEYVVDDESYETILLLVQAGKLCMYDHQDRHAYSLDNPCVGKGICLQHLLKKQSTLSVLDSPRVTEEGRHVYRFVDRKGYVYTTTEDSSDEANKSITDTLSYYGFTPPATIQGRGKSVPFYTCYASLYGDLPTASVIVLSYHHHSEHVKGLFLLYKNGSSKELQKRSDVYTRADQLVEATKDSQGQYHVNGYIHVSKYEVDTYEFVSQLESALYDVSCRLQNGNHKENQDGE